MKLKTVLMTQNALKRTSWDGLKWFGLEDMYVPYCYADHMALACGDTVEKGLLEIEVFETFEYLCCYENGEFIASFEFPFITESGQIITIKNFSLEYKNEASTS